MGRLRSIRLSTKLLVLIGTVVLSASLVYGWVSYQRQRQALLWGIDQELLAAAHVASLVPPEGYFDRLEDETSVSPAAYDRIVARNNALCEALDLQYLWSCMVVDGRVVFTTSTSPSHDVTKRDHARFFEEHQDPAAFETVFRTMEPDYSSFENEWGRGRMVLVPATDARGRKYCFGASLSTEEVDARLLGALRDTGLITLAILVAGLLLAWLLASRLTRPIVRIGDTAAAIARGELEASGPPVGPDGDGIRTRELADLSRSIEAMREAIRRRMQELREAETKQRFTLDSIGDAVIATDLKERVTRMNPAAETLTGWPLREAAGQWFSRVVHVEEPGTGRQVDRFLGDDVRELQRSRRTTDLVLVARDGSEHRVTTTVSPIELNGSVLGAVVVLRDVTERYRVEEQLRQSQKMEAVGQLAGGIAHDFNNMLAGIIGSAEMLRELCAGQEGAERFLDLLTASAERAADLVGKLLTFARKGKVESTPVDLNEIIETSVSLLDRSIGKQVELQTRLNAEPCVVVGDPSQLQSAFLNLALNARDAMPEGGELEITTESVTLDAPTIATHGFDVPPGPFVHLAVRDTGCGMDEETLSHIFEPFFTTKEVGKGTGLGLPAVYGAVHDHRGAIRVETARDVGTTFHLYLPRAAAARTGRRARVEQVETGSGLILVIDDEELIRAMAHGILEHLGYETLLAADGAEGLRLFEEHRDDIDLVLLDVVMPRMDGRACLAALREVDPDVRVLVASGFAGERTAQEFEEAGAAGFLKKPFDRTSLGQALARAFRNRRAPQPRTPNG